MADDFNVFDDADVSTGTVSIIQENTYEDIPVDFDKFVFSIFLYDRYRMDEKRNTHIKNLHENRWLRLSPIILHTYASPLPLNDYMRKVYEEYESGDNNGFSEPYDTRQNDNFLNSETEIAVEVVGEKFMVSYPDDTVAYKEFNILVPLVRWKMFQSWNDFIESFDPREYASRQARHVDEGDQKIGSLYFKSKDIVFPHSGHYFKNREGFETCTISSDPNEDMIEPIVANYETLLGRMKKISGDYRKFEREVKTGRFFKKL